MDTARQAFIERLNEIDRDRHEFVKRRLREMKLYDEQTEHAGRIGEAVEELSALFAQQAHHGESGSLALATFARLIGEWRPGMDESPE